MDAAPTSSDADLPAAYTFGRGMGDYRRRVVAHAPHRFQADVAVLCGDLRRSSLDRKIQLGLGFSFAL